MSRYRSSGASLNVSGTALITQWAWSFITFINPDTPNVNAQRIFQIDVDYASGDYSFAQTRDTSGDMYFRDYFGSTNVSLYDSGAGGTLTTGWQSFVTRNDVAFTQWGTTSNQSITADTTNKGTFQTAASPDFYLGSGNIANALYGYNGPTVVYNGYKLSDSEFLAALSGTTDPSTIAVAYQTNYWAFANSTDLTDSIGSVTLSAGGTSYSTNEPTFGGTPVSNSLTAEYETLSGVKQSLISQYESMGYIAKQRTVLFETLQAIHAEKIAQYEGLSGLNQQAIMQIESLYRALAQHVVQFEYLQHATNTAQVNFESKGSALISSSVAIAFETLHGIALSKTLPIESLDKIASQVQAQIEAGQGISKTYNLFFEGKGFVSQTAINRLEVVAYLSAANIAQFESLQLISGTADLNIEALRLIANAAGVSFEALLGAGITVVVNTVTRTAHFTVTLERTATFGDTVSRTATFGDVINRTIKFH